MFNRKTERKTECPNPFADKVKCGECKCWLDKNDAYRVRYMHGFDDYYCSTHRKPYIRVVTSLSGFGVHYYADVQVDVNGVPLGYMKIAEKRKRGRPKKV